MKCFCTENCNECEVTENRQLALLLNYLIEKYGEQIIQEVNKFCPNLTCCPDCRIDDFVILTVVRFTKKQRRF